MRKVILQELVTVDGLAAGPNGELDFFDVVTDYSEVDRDNLQMLEGVDTILLGDRTYRMFVEYWPTAEGEPVAESVNTIPKVVFMSTNTSPAWPGKSADLQSSQRTHTWSNASNSCAAAAARPG